jgi:hypothetical protein
MTYQVGPTLKSTQRQMLYGTILGGSSVIRPARGKNCYLAMRDQDELWLSYKIEVLKDFFKIDSNLIKKEKNTSRCYSVSYPIFNLAYDTFYEEGVKRVTPEILEILTDEAWMVWFVDAGRKVENTAYLRTQKFGEQGTALIAEYFNSVDCECAPSQIRGRHEIVFTKKGTISYLEIIAPVLPNFLIKKYD